MLPPVLTSSVRVGFDTLRANPLRTLLSTLGIIMGVASLVAVLSLGDGVEQYARSQISRTTDLQTITVDGRRMRIVDGQPFPVEHPVRLTTADADSLARLAGPGALSTLVVRGQSLVATGDTAMTATAVIGAGPDVLALRDMRVVAGRMFSAEEARAAAPVVVVTRALADTLARRRGGRPVLGDSLRFMGQARVVVGIIDVPDGETARGREAVMPPGAAEATIAGMGPPALPTAIVKMPTVEAVTAAQQRIEAWAARRWTPAWKDRVTVSVNRARLEQVQQGMLIFKLLMGALTGISLLVGGIGIMNVMLASVIERTREIGIRKATGARNRHILVQFLAESVTITGVGSAVGIALGLAGSYGVTAVMRRMTEARVFAGVSASTLLVAVGASVGVGLVFGLYPARRAAALAPIEAIHHE